MIILPDGNAPFSTEGLSELEKEIYEQKQQSPRDYHYPSAEALRFELKLRAAIAEAAQALFDSSVAFASFKKARCNPDYWTLTEEGGFRLKPGAKPSAAVRDIYKNGRKYAFECATAIIIVMYKGVLETIGDEAFDRLFGNLYLLSWHHDDDLRLITEYDKKDTYTGDALYFKNPDVDPATPEWQGENVIQLPKGKYYGHGIGIKDADGIVAKLNRHRKKNSDVSAYLLNQATYPNFFYIQQAASGESPQQRPWPSGAVVGRIGRRTQLYV